MLATILFALLTTVPAPPPDDVHVAKDWLVALRSTLHGGTTAADVERVLALYADDVVYEHPRVGMRVDGKAEVRRGMMRFLDAYAGGPEDVHMSVADIRALPGVVVVDVTVSLRARGRGSEPAGITRRQIVVLHVRDGHITRVLDHW